MWINNTKCRYNNAEKGECWYVLKDKRYGIVCSCNEDNCPILRPQHLDKIIERINQNERLKKPIIPPMPKELITQWSQQLGKGHIHNSKKDYTRKRKHKRDYTEED